MTTTTPGRRLHAALLAHGIVRRGGWETYHPHQHEDFEAAAREYDADAPHCPLCTKELPNHAYGCSESKDALRDRIDALTAEVAALRRAQDADLYAAGEVGDRLGRCEAAVVEAAANVGAIGGKHNEFAAHAIVRMGDIEDRLAALEARAPDGGDPMRRTG